MSMPLVEADELPLPCEAGCETVAELREENALLRAHIRAAEQASGIARGLIIEQFREVERVLNLLQRENALRKGILDAASTISIIYCDLDGAVQLFNQGAEQLLDYGADEVVGHRNIDDFRLPGEIQSCGGLRAIAETARRGQMRNRECVYVRRGGKLVPVMLSVSAVLDQEDNVAGLMFAATDISEAKTAERALWRKNEEQAALLQELRQAHEQLLQSEKMASLGQLAAGVAHEINNPIGFVNSNLGTLSGYAQQLLQLVAAYESAEPALAAAPDMRRAIDEAKREAELDYLREDLVALIDESRDGLKRVTKIVQDLKTFSHMGETRWEWADLHEGLESTLNVVGNELKYKATVEKRYGELPQVYCVLSQLNQVFMNILVNAAQAMDQPGTITISTAREGDRVLVSIHDSGKGIPPDHLKKIFDPFFTTKPVGKGTGLGLYLAFNIVKKHEGEISAESELGRGTTFTLRLPIEPKGEGRDGPRPAAPRD